MTPGARIQAAIELLDQILTAWRSEKRIPADKLLDGYFKGHRYIGSKDRGAIAELTYWTLRHKATIEWWLQKIEFPYMTGRSMAFAAVLLRGDQDARTLQSITQDSRFSPQSLSKTELKLGEDLAGRSLTHPDMPMHVKLNYPQWMTPLLEQAFGEDIEEAMEAMSEQAPTDLRVNTLKATREKLIEELRKEGFEVEPTPVSPIGVRLKKRAAIFTSATFKKGWFEVQDEGSQMVAVLTDAQPSHKIIDFCAGAGGKTLAIAAAMENKGRLMAWDVSEKRLSQITIRLRRAGVGNVQTHVLSSESDPFIKRHKYLADRVLVDAPCSGTGTWRRNPDLKWRFTQKDLDEVLDLQERILESASRLVKPGGRLIYATCSILKSENDEQVSRFLTKKEDFRVVCAEKVWNKSSVDGDGSTPSYLSLTPHEDGVDGFFAAVFERLPAK
ncbi:MAG: RsmB/NOP family class I SAM-dependent RNA methyltransferase [Alphaproteobacteria bacterium]|nr:RsmB/NOP family class I SAM-dependent RNA methyltransferase [Alphaproteobacteria bacterium]